MALVGHYSLHAYKICIFEPQDNGTEQNKNVWGCGFSPTLDTWKNSKPCENYYEPWVALGLG